MKTRSLTQPVEYVWSKDPALDLPEDPDARAALARKYMESLFDEQHRPVRAGETPARFRLGPLPYSVYRRVQKMDDPADRVVEAALHSLQGVRDWEHNGAQVVIGPDDFTKVGDRRLTDDWVGRHYDPMLFMELGLAILEVSGLLPTRS